MTIAEWLVHTMIKLRDAGVDSPRRDSLVLLEDTIEKDRAWILAHPEFELDTDTINEVDTYIKERLARKPLAYIRGRAWFYGRFFEVNKNVLIPRPETENFIDLLKNLRTNKLIDIGTGSGALAITAALELPQAKVIAIDNSSTALELAQKNAAFHKVEITFLLGSLFEPLTDLNIEHFTVAANLPYVPDGLVTSPEIKQEPAEALFAGQDGLDIYSQFWKQLNSLRSKPKHILVESLESQHDKMTNLAHKAGYELDKTDQLIQQFKKQA